MNIAPSLVPWLWAASIVGVVAILGLVVGVTLLLGTVPHRKVALPTVWISAAILAACVTAVILILFSEGV